MLQCVAEKYIQKFIKSYKYKRFTPILVGGKKDFERFADPIMVILNSIELINLKQVGIQDKEIIAYVNTELVPKRQKSSKFKQASDS